MDAKELQRVKVAVDCRKLVEADLRPPRQRGTKAWKWRCPLHQEKHGYSLAVWAEGWYYFGACSTGGDAITWLQQVRGLDFIAACRELGLPESDSPDRPRGERKRPLPVMAPAQPPIAEPPPRAWQTAVWKIVADAQAMLWKPDGERALAYLEQKRGLNQTIIWEARLGYIPGDYRQWRTLHGLKVPCGISIPWFVDAQVWALKVMGCRGCAL